MRVVCASIPGPGHAYPMLAVAGALAARGHAVTIASGGEHRADAGEAGASFVELPRTAGSPRHALRPHDDASEQAVAFLPTLARLAPDVVVHDLLTIGPMLAAEAIGAPAATLVIHGLHLASRELPPFGWGGPPGTTPFGRVRDAWMRRGQRRDLLRAREALNRARARLGLPPTGRLDGQVSADLVLVATLPSLEIPRADWPAKAHVVGPCLWGTGEAAPRLPDGDGALVLVAPSTAHDGALLRDALDAVVRLGLRAVVTAGASRPPDRLPAGVVVAGFAAHDPLLRVSHAVVCNGGHGIVARALSAAVPLVVAPGHGDQRENAWRVERAGAGIAVRKPTAGKITRALRAVLEDPRYRERALQVSTEAQSMLGPARAAELIERLAEARKAMGGGQVPAPLPNGGLD